MNVNIDRNTERIRSPSFTRKKLFFAAIIVGLAVISLNIFLRPKKDHNAQIFKEDITLFLENVMIRESGLFTLLGSKPITQFDISASLPETEEDLKNEYEKSRAFLQKCKEDPEHFHSDTTNLPEYKEYREKCLRYKDQMRFQDHKKLWDIWLQEKGCLSNQMYKITSRGDFGLFINVPNTVFILKKFYNDFSKTVGFEFDANTIIDSIDDENSNFWNVVFKNHYLFGLIMGYGQKNSHLFDWTRQNSLSLDLVSLLRFKDLSRLDQHVKVQRKINVGLHDLEIPYFVSFAIGDEDIERYSREREKIFNLLEDKDLVAFILKELE